MVSGDLLLVLCPILGCKGVLRSLGILNDDWLPADYHIFLFLDTTQEPIKDHLETRPFVRYLP